MKVTWYGHSAFRIEAAGANILIDPFLSGNPSWDGGWEGPAEGVTHVLLTHGHADHLGDSLAILKKTGAMLVANFEVCMYLVGQGVGQDKINPGNHGGTVDCGGFTTTFVQARHSSSFPLDDGTNVYLGNPAGLVLHFPQEKTLYYMGGTDIFGDMALIEELHHPAIGIVPIGDRFTMDPAMAARATELIHPKIAIPIHYKTWPLLVADAVGFKPKGIKVKVMEPGEIWLYD